MKKRLNVRVDLSFKTYSLTLGMFRRHTFTMTMRNKFMTDP